MAKRARPKPARADRQTHRPERPVPKQSRASIPAQPTHKAPPPSESPSAGALVLFQQGIEALQRHAYGPAADRFRALLAEFPDERVLLDRTHVYIEICQRELQKRPADPRTVEERLTAATAALNDGDDARAEELVQSVLAADGRQDLALYLMAAIEARRGRIEPALSYLSQAIAISPDVRAQARHDTDFEALRGAEGFHALIDPPTSPLGRRLRRR
jgi:tetratricopeptide (TPR) repeat protein